MCSSYSGSFIGPNTSICASPAVATASPAIEIVLLGAGVLGFASVDKQPDDERLYLFAGVDGVRFKRPVVPGDRLMMTAEVDSTKRNIWRFACSASVDDRLVCEATILCALEAP